MSLVKRTYVDQVTVITAENLNAIQDCIIENEAAIESQDDDIGELQDAVGDGALDPDFTATNLTGAANELKNDVGSAKNTKAPVIVDTASGAIASFPDGADGMPVKDLTVSIDPIQDLHGYDSPWPAGGGKNLLGLTLTALKALNTAGTWTENVYVYFGLTYTVATDVNDYATSISVKGTNTNSTYTTFFLGTFATVNDTVYTLSGVPSGQLFAYVRNTTEGVNDSGSGIDFTGTGANHALQLRVTYQAEIITPLTILPMIRLASISDSSFVPYENICPISGRTGCNISRTGKNLFNMNLLNSSHVTVQDGVASGAASYFNADFGSGISGLTVPSGQLALSLDAYTDGNASTESNGLLFRFEYTDGTVSTAITISNATQSYTHYTAASNSAKTVKAISISFSAKGTNIWHVKNVQLEICSEATAYQAFGQSIPISWQTEAGTVYGGTLDVTSGKLSRTQEIMVLDGSSDESWSGHPSISNWFAYQIPFECQQTSTENSFKANWLKPYYGSSSNIPIGSFMYSNTSQGVSRLLIRTDVADNANDLKTYLSQNNLTVTFIRIPLSSDIDISPVTVQTLLGQNNVWADCGDVEVEYPCDTKLYIDKRIAAVVAALS